MSAEEIREFAEECQNWARAAVSEGQRELLLQMARTWTMAASRYEAD
jgi:hypothetical protein